MNKNITSPNGLTLLTAGKYCDQNITVKPVLQEKSTTENGDIVADSGYAGLSKVTVNVASGAELNIAYGATAPEDTSKLWVEGTEPSKVIVTNKELEKVETISTLSATLPNAMSNACCASVGSNIYIFGGAGSIPYNTILKFDTTTKILTTLTVRLPSRRERTSCASVGTDIYIFGGFYNGTFYNTILKFDTTTETITTLSATLPNVMARTSCASVGSNIYIFGGEISGGWLNTILKFDTTTETITTLSATLPNVMSSACCASVGSNIYIFGGAGSGSVLNTILKFDTTTETITTLSTTLPNVMSSACCASVGSNIYIFGGAGSIPYNTILKFDTTTETITTLSATLPNAMSNACCASVDTDIYIFGGYGSTSYNTIYEFTVSVPLPQNQLLLNTTLTKNLFKIINAPSAEIEIGVNAVYRGNANNIAELETANVYDGNQYAWVDVQSGAVVEKLASVVTITSQASDYAFNVYDGTNTSGNLVATLGGANGALTAKVPCFSGYLYFQNTNASTAWEGFTVASNMTVTGGTDNYQLVQVNGDGAISATVVEVVAGYTLTINNISPYNINGYVDGTITYKDGTTATLSNAGDGQETVSYADVTYIKLTNINHGNETGYATITGATENELMNGLTLTANVTIDIYWDICFVEGTQITLADGSTKAIEDITYDDELLTWNFDEGKLESRKPCWIAKAGNTNYYWNTELSDGTTLQLVGKKAHRLFNAEQGKFIYAPDCINEHTFKQDGTTPTVISCEKIEKPVKYYNLATEYNINVFANGILTSQRLNNMYPIKDMNFVKYKKPVVNREDYAEIPDRFYYGLRVAEQSESQNTENAVVFHKTIKEHILHNMVERDILYKG